MASLSRKVQQLEEDLEKSEEKTRAAQVKFEQVSQAGDESERSVYECLKMKNDTEQEGSFS